MNQTNENNSNYRKKYKQYYGIDFDGYYAIHHIDFDRTNNDIENLLLLPRGLHTKYHSCLSTCADERHMINGVIGELKKHQLTAMTNLATALKEIEKWRKWKGYGYDPCLVTLIFDGTEEYEVGHVCY